MQYVPLRPRRGPLTLTALAALAIFAAGCQDSVTTPDAAGPPASPHGFQGTTQDPVVSASEPFACVTGLAVPGRPNTYRYGRMRLEFPKNALASDGATMRYRLREVRKSGELLALANCIIPRTIPAVEQMNRRFRVPPRSGLPAGGGRPEGDVVIIMESGCAEGDAFFTDGCTSVGDPNPPPKDACDPSDTTCGGGGDTDWGTGGTGSGGTESGSDLYGDDEEWDCHSLPGCKSQLELASSGQMEIIQNEINKIRADKHDVCRRVKENALLMAQRPVYVWKDEFKNDVGKTLLGDTYAVKDANANTIGAGFHLWAQSLDAETIAHEAMHGFWTSTLDGWHHDVKYEGRTLNTSKANGIGWETYCTT